MRVLFFSNAHTNLSTDSSKKVYAFCVMMVYCRRNGNALVRYAYSVIII